MSPSTIQMHGRDHLPNGSDPIPWFPTIPAFGDALLATADLAAFWKLNEASGTTAADSSGNGWDLSSSGFVAPTWGHPAIVGTDPSAGFAVQGAIPPQRLALASFPDLDVDDFTALIFLRRSGVTFDAMIGQGSAVAGGGDGWALLIQAFNQGPGNRPYVIKSGNSLDSPTAITDTAAHMVATSFEFATNTWTLYQDGENVGSEVDAFTGASGIWIGAADPAATTEQFDGDLGYGAIFTRRLADEEIESFWTLFSAGTFPDYWVLTMLGGRQVWLPPTIEVEF